MNDSKHSHALDEQFLLATSGASARRRVQRLGLLGVALAVWGCRGVVLSDQRPKDGSSDSMADVGTSSTDALALDDSADTWEEGVGGQPDATMRGTTIDSGRDEVAQEADAGVVVTCDSGTPVPVCVQYYAVLSACLGMDLTSEACQASLIPSSQAELQQIEYLCSVNLQRIQQACP